MSMYNLTRQEAAEKLNVSTRSVDRYINAWKIRSKKTWKIVYVNEDDINTILWVNTKQEVIVEKKSENSNFKESKTTNIYKNNQAWTLWAIYKDLKEEIQKKDQLIQTLAMRVWKAEEVANSSVSLLDFKKSQYLLEESKDNLNKNINELETRNAKLNEELKYEKKTTFILIVFVILLLVVAGIIWFMKI